jgi:hypothetical protein
MRIVVRRLRLFCVLGLAVAAGCSGTGGRQEALGAATEFVDAAAATGLVGAVDEPVRHGPWWEVTVTFEEREAIVLFIDPQEYRVEHVERGLDDVVTPDEFLANPFGLPRWRLGEPVPGLDPRPFRPDIFSGEGEYGFHLHSSIEFSPDGRELYFTDQTVPVVLGTSKSIWVMRWDGNQWESPTKATFSSDYSDDGAWISPDGRRLYFQSERPQAPGADPAPGFWWVERDDGGWSEPRLLVTAADVVPWYVSAAFPGSSGAEDVYRAEFREGHYGPLAHMGSEINSDMEDYAACVAPDESFMILYRFDPDRKDESGLYVSFRDGQGGWAQAVQLGRGTKLGAAFDASLSPDGEYLFFLRRGDGIYWVDAGILEAYGPDT